MLGFLAVIIFHQTFIHSSSSSSSLYLAPSEASPPDPPFVKPSASSSSPFAYAFLLGGLDPSNLTPYRGYLYNIAVATHVLRSEGSTADIVVLIQIAPQAQADRLPDKETRFFEQDLGIRLHYLPSSNRQHQSFLSIMLQKFRILQMTQYERVLFLDADIVVRIRSFGSSQSDGLFCVAQEHHSYLSALKIRSFVVSTLTPGPA